MYFLFGLVFKRFFFNLQSLIFHKCNHFCLANRRLNEIYCESIPSHVRINQIAQENIVGANWFGLIGGISH